LQGHSAESNVAGDAQGGQRSELAQIGGLLIGLLLIIGAVNNQAVRLSNHVVPELPAPGVLAVRIPVGMVGALLLLSSLISRGTRSTRIDSDMMSCVVPWFILDTFSDHYVIVDVCDRFR